MHLRIEFLDGVYRSASFDDASVAEWPPHPARVFSALVEAHYAGDQDPIERAALKWLEAQPPPSMTVSSAQPRTVAPHFVPVNDIGLMESKVNVNLAELLEVDRELAQAADARARKKAERQRAKFEKRLAATIDRVQAGAGAISDDLAAKALKGLLDQRTKQPRTFPAVIPDDPVVWFHWDTQPDDQQAAALQRVVRRLTRLGHSSTLVHARWTDTAPELTHRPDPDGDLRLRTVSEGQLQALDDEFDRSRATLPRILPFKSTTYRSVDDERSATTPESLFGTAWITFRCVRGERPPIARAVDLAQAFRRAMLAANGPLPGFITGHDADRPHVAFVPLPYVGSEHATGDLFGLAVVPPRDLDAADTRALHAALARWVLVHEGDEDETKQAIPLAIGRYTLELDRIIPGQRVPATLRPGTWTRRSREWVTVTPVALGRNPGDLYTDHSARRAKAVQKAEQTLRDAVERIGLPAPRQIDVFTDAPLKGSLAARRFPPFPPQRGRTRRVKVHARLVFDEPVRGPILLGAGRYQGTGLFRPVGGVG